MKSVRNAWKRSGLTQKQFAAEAGFSVSTLKRYMHSVKVPRFRQAAIRNVTFVHTHSSRAVARRNERLRATAIRREAMARAREDTSEMKFSDLSGNIRTLSGRKAGQVRAAYIQANANRVKLGLPEISQRGYYGDPEKLLGVLRHKNSLRSLQSRQENGRRGFKASIRTGLEYAIVPPKQIQQVMDILNRMNNRQIDAMYRVAANESWFILISPPAEGSKLPAAPDVSGIFAYLGLERNKLNIKL